MLIKNDNCELHGAVGTSIVILQQMASCIHVFKGGEVGDLRRNDLDSVLLMEGLRPMLSASTSLDVGCPPVDQRQKTCLLITAGARMYLEQINSPP